VAFTKLRRNGGPVALLSCVTVLSSLFPARVTRAAEEVRENEPEAVTESEVVVDPELPAGKSPAATPADVAHAAQSLHTPSGVELPGVGGGPPSIVKDVNIGASGGDKTGVSSQAIALPQGAGKIQGMGESFSAQLSTGVASFNVPIQLIPARGSADPALSLAYSSAGGHGVAGVGWEVGWPSISRQTDRGIPSYLDTADFQPNQDRFVFGGGQELVPICVVTSAGCAGAIAGEVMPSWATGWQYFRSRVEGSYERFFWSPDHGTWRVQSKSGQQMELGLPLDGSGYTGGLEVDPGDSARIFKWNVVRQYDAYPNTGGATPAPANPVVYRYLQDGGSAYLAEIYDTPHAGDNAGQSPLSTYAHHTRLNYATRPDVTQSYRRGWLTTQGLRLGGIDVTSMPFASKPGSARELVRRYHLAYDPAFHVSLLKLVQMEGRPVPNAVENASETLPAGTGGPLLPAMTFDYQHVTPYNGDGTPGSVDLAGYEGFDDRTVPMAQSPDHSVDEALADLFDINSDGLPDLLVTMPALYGGSDGVFFNGTSGAVNSVTPGTVPVLGALGATAADITLANPNILAADLDGDGTIDFLHQPAVKTYAVYTPTKQPNGSFALVGRNIPAANLQDPHLDLGSDTPDINVMDVNGDGLVDVVRATGTEIDTFYSLGRYPNGDGNFGSATWSGPYGANLSLAAVTSCVPWDGVPVQFSDPTVQIADMNGDGLPDIVRVEQGNLHYWPGRGDGVWGTGPTSACQPGNFSEGTFVPMANSPQYANPSGSGVRLNDINGDGLDDVIEVNFGVVNVWLNVDGVGFTPAPHVITGFTPASGPDWLSKVRLVDMNGSGTRDVFWGEAGSYRFIDVAGGERPWVLTHVENGLGKTTDLTYSTSTALMQAAAAAGTPWTSVAPMPLHVVTQMVDRDNLGLAGRPSGVYVTQYSYANPVYDGRQREFRGFQSAWTTKVGDSNSPTSITSSSFLLGQCVDDEVPPPGVTSRCLPATRWTDNTREALKGLPLVSETYDANGIYVSSTHHSYTLRRLYTGLDGREVRVAFESATDQYSYENAPFARGTATASFADVSVDLEGGVAAPGYVTPTTLLTVRGVGDAHVQSSAVVDLFGNGTQSASLGCVDCTPADTAIVSHSVPAVVPNDPGGWLWRTIESWVDSPTGKRKDTFFQYNLGGSLTSTSAVLSGTLPLVRSHATGAAIAPAPTAASTDGTITVATQAYDEFGNPTLSIAPNGRCRRVGSASDYADLPTSETVYVGTPNPANSGCGATPLTASAQYDRGLNLVTLVTDLHGEVSYAEYDGFGRTAAVTKPDPTNLGSLSPNPSVTIDYYLPVDPTTQPFAAFHTHTLDGANPSVVQYRDTWTYTDGMGRTIVTVDMADPVAGDAAPWIASGLPDYDAKGASEHAYIPRFWSGAPGPTTFPKTSPSPYTWQVYDAFGRGVRSYPLDQHVSPTLQNFYHPLSADAWDAEDLNVGGSHYGTFATSRKDGHGRPVSMIERVHVGTPATLELHDTQMTYLTTGEVESIRRTRGAGDDVVRWMQYDTLGRLVLNAEPNTSTGFSPVVGTTAGLASWRYAYDDNGDVVGTSDARGCGANFFYDAGGRILAEDFSPCLASHAPYSAPNLTTGDGTEAFYWYDTLDPELALQPLVTTGSYPYVNLDGCFVAPEVLAGRLVSISDRASRTVNGYDGRGRTQCIAKQIASPGVASATLASRYAPSVYAQTVTFDAADRPVTASTGARAVLDSTMSSYVTTSYSRRGVVDQVTSGYGTLVSSITRAADGPVNAITYGDLASTQTAFTYDGRRRVATVQTKRGPPASWPTAPTSPSTVYQHDLEDAVYHYDLVDNPVGIDDNRNPAEWPAGAQPVSRTVAYDDLYRATSMGYTTGATPDVWVDPFLAEANDVESDPRRALPSPHVSFANRVQSQTVAYDWLGNTTQSGDDVGGFYDRSLGSITNGGTGAGPYQLTGASGGTSPRQGLLTTAYDAAGNLAALSVVRATAPCLPTGSVCSQRYTYDWDEVGRLVRARRWDGQGLGVASTPSPTSTPAVDLGYAYDSTDDRTVKSATDANGNEVFTVYVYDALELRRTTWTGTDYVDSTATEVPYLFAHGVRLARVHFATVDPTLNASGTTHVILELADHLGSSTIALDQATGELVERGTYEGYGAADSDYRPTGWGSFREDYRFTGKEEDVEVGLDYFGKRFYAPMLGRWVSADPLAVHSPGSADLNVYAYVHGRVLSAVDPIGLDLWQYAKGLAVGGATLAWETTKANIAGSSIGEVYQAVQSVRQGDYVGAALHAYKATPDAQIQKASIETVVGPIAALAALPRQLKDVGNAGNDFEAGKRAFAPVLTIATTVAAVAGAAKGIRPVEVAEGCAGGICAEPKVGCFVAGTLVEVSGGLAPIELVALGERVRTVDDGSCAKLTHDGLLFRVRLALPSNDGSADTIDIELLRDSQWLRSGGLEVGSSTFLRISELDVEGDAFVEEIEPWGAVSTGEGCVVTGRLTHYNSLVLSLGLDSVPDSLEVTWLHPVYSVTRDGWVKAGDLTVGDSLLGHDGPVEVSSIDPVPATLRVYNLEVEEVHSYRVTPWRVLVHNQCSKPGGTVAAGEKTYQTYTKTNPDTGKVYSGRTSGTGTPKQNVARRDVSHHMNDEGYGPAELDNSSASKSAIRGREQQLIDASGGAQSQGGTSGNAINGISPSNKNGPGYIEAANKEFGK
jgi:RHS repeat-associated protein